MFFSQKKLQKYLHMSKICCNFAVDFGAVLLQQSLRVRVSCPRIGLINNSVSALLMTRINDETNKKKKNKYNQKPTLNGKQEKSLHRW